MNDQPKQAAEPAATPKQQQKQVGEQYFAQPGAAPVQYVVAAPSLKGISGWLFFFLAVFALNGIFYLFQFFTTLPNITDSVSVINLIFSLPLAAACIATTVLIAMRKKLGKIVAIGSLGIFLIYSIVTLIVDFAGGTNPDMNEISTLIGTMLASVIANGLLILYFLVSKRVKETLVD